MRPIDGDKLIEEANKDGAYGYVSVKEIADAPTIEQYGTWIPCSERLPEEYKTVLFCGRAGTVNQGFYESIDREKPFVNADGKIGHPKVDGGMWHRDRFQDFIPGRLVIAWMPLPEPYREEKKDEKDS